MRKVLRISLLLELELLGDYGLIIWIELDANTLKIDKYAIYRQILDEFDRKSNFCLFRVKISGQ